MNKVAIKAVCDALRSGHYLQGDVHLYDPKTGKYCVGGVCMAACAKAKGMSVADVTTSALRDWLGFPEAEMINFADWTQRLNQRTIPFGQIAELIEVRYYLRGVRELAPKGRSLLVAVA